MRVADLFLMDRYCYGPPAQTLWSTDGSHFSWRMMTHSIQVILPTAPAVSNEGGRGFSPLGPGAGCFLALGSGLGLVGTASARR